MSKASSSRPFSATASLVLDVIVDKMMTAFQKATEQGAMGEDDFLESEMEGECVTSSTHKSNKV